MHHIFESCDLDLIAAFGAPHLLANHRSSVAFLFYVKENGTYDKEMTWRWNSQITRGNADERRILCLIDSRNGGVTSQLAKFGRAQRMYYRSVIVVFSSGNCKQWRRAAYWVQWKSFGDEMKELGKAPESIRNFCGTLARPIDTITTLANIAVSQAQEHQQWPIVRSRWRKHRQKCNRA